MAWHWGCTKVDLSNKQIALAVAGGAILMAAVYSTIQRTGAPGTGPSGKAPRIDSAAQASGNIALQGLSAPVNMLGISTDGGFTWESRLLHFFDPDSGHVNPGDCDYGHYVRHRYPTISGTNISTLIHKGYSPLMVPSTRDYDWITCPPADAEFESGV